MQVLGLKPNLQGKNPHQIAVTFLYVHPVLQLYNRLYDGHSKRATFLSRYNWTLTLKIPCYIRIHAPLPSNHMC